MAKLVVLLAIGALLLVGFLFKKLLEQRWGRWLVSCSVWLS
jgi:hypothetical protein